MMIANKTQKVMSTEMVSLDSALWSPLDQSFFSDDCSPQTQHCNEIASELASDQWLQDFEDIKSFCDNFDLGLTYEPELPLEAMTKEADIQYQSKANDMIDYLDSTAFLSPLSMEPSSPLSTDGHHTQELDSSAIDLLEEILSSANSSDSEYTSDQCYDSELNIQSITEVSKDQTLDSIENKLESQSQPKATPKRQTKRKAPSSDDKPKAIKRSKTTQTERKERKRNQNKNAANRYRQKKRAEMDTIEQQSNHFLELNSQLKAQLQKLQMEFKVVYPLAKAAFASDPNKALKLQMLDLRVLTDNLLE